MAIAPIATGRRRARRGRMSEINVTPFVDVMLVLLVVFMVTAPLLTVGVEVDLPKADTAPVRQTEEPLSVSIDRSGQVFLQETKVTLVELGPRLRAISQRRPDVRIFVRGDQGIPYGRIMEVMGVINAAGLTHVALITEPPRGPARR